MNHFLISIRLHKVLHFHLEHAATRVNGGALKKEACVESKEEEGCKHRQLEKEPSTTHLSWTSDNTPAEKKIPFIAITCKSILDC